MKARFVKARRETLAVERLVGPAGLRGLPWHAILRDRLANGTATAEERVAAEVSRQQWEAIRDKVPSVRPCTQ